MADAVERGWKVDMMAVIGNRVRSLRWENAVCFSYMLRATSSRPNAKPPNRCTPAGESVVDNDLESEN
jgi:hypothetical protein